MNKKKKNNTIIYVIQKDLLEINFKKDLISRVEEENPKLIIIIIIIIKKRNFSHFVLSL